MAAPTFHFSTDSILTGSSGFIVVSFTGKEKMSELFKYVINVKILKTITIDPAVVITEDANFTFAHSDVTPSEVMVSGVLSSFDYLRSDVGTAGYNHYCATLVPAAWKKTLGVDFEIFLNMSPKSIITEEISDAGLAISASTTGILSSSSSSANLERDFVCQYNESDFDFISRIAEHHGVYYYFDHANNSEMIFADDNLYPDCGFPQLAFDPAAAGDGYYTKISDLTCATKSTVNRVTVSGYNPDQPSVKIKGSEGTDHTHTGCLTKNLKGENASSPEEANYIAKIRFEQIKSEATVYSCESGAIHLCPGFTYALTGHTVHTYNSSHLIVAVEHKGNNLDDSAINPVPGVPYYKNTFTAIPAHVQFRPTKSAPIPSANTEIGTVYAEAASPRQAERNEDGKYRVKFQCVDDETTEVKKSYWLRMASLAAGSEDTLDIPLKGGVEVQIGFEGGNPDKPFIQSAIPNARFPAHVTAKNPNNALISTSGLLGLKANGGSNITVHVNEPDWENRVFGTLDNDHRPFKQIDRVEGEIPSALVTQTSTEIDEYSGANIITRRYGDEYKFIDGNTYVWDNEKMFCFGNDYEEIHESEDDLATEVFNMEAAMQSIGTHPTGGDYSGWEDGGDGLTEKTWGDKAEFHQGRSFNWSGGEGPGGSLETYNYGNGYTENLLEKSGGTAASNSLTTKHDDHTTFSEIDPGISSIEKSWGNAYSYSEGFSADVKVGNAKSKTYGDTDDYMLGNAISVTSGNSTETVTGNSNSTVNGDSTEDVTGFSKSIVHGHSDSMTYGNSSDICHGATNDMQMGASNSMFFGVSNSMAISLNNDMQIGFDIGFQLAGHLKITAGFGIDRSAGRINSEDIKMSATPGPDLSTGGIVLRGIGLALFG
jgi:type VI secretion system secreted protein VgrG